MMSRIRSLERQLACQRAQVIVSPIAEDFVEAWELSLEAGKPPADTLELIQVVVAKGIAVLAAGPLVTYLDRCRLDGEVPTPEYIVEAIVHGYALSKRVIQKPCRCLIPQTPSLW